MKYLLRVMILMLLASSLFSLTGEIVYLEGTVDIKPGAGELEWADFGTPVNEGDSIITGQDGYCEVELEGGSTVTIKEDTIFSFSKNSVGRKEPQNVFNCGMGQISYKFSNMKDEPLITTPSAACGIRGTAFTVIAGADGSSLFVVSEGEVEVESMGQRVSLTLDEAVEVSSGKAPGEKYPVLSGSLDYSSWLDMAEKAALEDPAGTVEELTDRLVYYISEMDRYHGLYLVGRQEMEVLLSKIKKLRDEEKDAEAEDKYENIYIPLNNQTADYSINIRYYALSALSLRRYTLGGLYVKLRAAHFQQGSDKYSEFLKVYQDFLTDYNSICEVPFLVDADI